MFKKPVSVIVIIAFIFSLASPYKSAHADLLNLPVPGTMVNISPAYQPVIIRGLTVHKDNPFMFDFIVDIGQDHLSAAPLKAEGEKLIKYFLASLAIPDKDAWVNLSPYEKDKIVPDALGQTEMGRDLLEQDYVLKQITASLIYPEKLLGRIFWDKVYAKAQKQFGATQIPVNTFNKVWIMADRAEVFEHAQSAFVVDQHLKVMLQEDYLALAKHNGISSIAANTNSAHSIGSQIVREVALPALEKEVNTGKNFANLRQIFNSIILASWYKKNLKEALLNQVYADKSKVKGIDLNDPSIKQQIFEQYLKAYKKGVFNYIKEEVNAANGQALPRKYFSGGVIAATVVKVTKDVERGTEQLSISMSNADPLVLMRAVTDTGSSTQAMMATFAKCWSDFSASRHKEGRFDDRNPLAWDSIYGRENIFFKQYENKTSQELKTALTKLLERNDHLYLPFLSDVANAEFDELEAFIIMMQRPQVFSDATSWPAELAVQKQIRRAQVEDVDGNAFNPNEFVVKDEIVAILWRLFVLWDKSNVAMVNKFKPAFLPSLWKTSPESGINKLSVFGNLVEINIRALFNQSEALDKEGNIVDVGFKRKDDQIIAYLGSKEFVVKDPEAASIMVYKNVVVFFDHNKVRFYRINSKEDIAQIRKAELYPQLSTLYSIRGFNGQDLILSRSGYIDASVNQPFLRINYAGKPTKSSYPFSVDLRKLLVPSTVELNENFVQRNDFRGAVIDDVFMDEDQARAWAVGEGASLEIFKGQDVISPQIANWFSEIDRIKSILLRKDFKNEYLTGQVIEVRIKLRKLVSPVAYIVTYPNGGKHIVLQDKELSTYHDYDELYRAFKEGRVKEGDAFEFSIDNTTGSEIIYAKIGFVTNEYISGLSIHGLSPIIIGRGKFKKALVQSGHLNEAMTGLSLSTLLFKTTSPYLADRLREKDFVVESVVGVPHTNILPGGIDLNTMGAMRWKISKDGKGVEMNIDPAMIARFRREGIHRLSPVILSITPINSIWSLIGLNSPSRLQKL